MQARATISGGCCQIFAARIEKLFYTISKVLQEANDALMVLDKGKYGHIMAAPLHQKESLCVSAFCVAKPFFEDCHADTGVASKCSHFHTGHMLQIDKIDAAAVSGITKCGGARPIVILELNVLVTNVDKLIFVCHIATLNSTRLIVTIAISHQCAILCNVFSLIAATLPLCSVPLPLLKQRNITATIALRQQCMLCLDVVTVAHIDRTIDRDIQRVHVEDVYISGQTAHLCRVSTVQLVLVETVSQSEADQCLTGVTVVDQMLHEEPWHKGLHFDTARTVVVAVLVRSAADRRQRVRFTACIFVLVEHL